MNIARRLGSIALLGFAAAPADAQNGAMWVNDRGQMMSFMFSGGDGAPPPPVDRAPAEMAAQFKSLCMESASGLAMPGVAEKAGLTAEPFTVSAGKKAAPVTLGIWRGPGTVATMTEGYGGANVPQCNVVYYVATLPERQAVADALSAAFGSPPSNLAEATDKKGKPKKFYTPEWTFNSAGGAQIVVAHVAKGNRYMPGNRVQLSIRAAKEAGK